MNFQNNMMLPWARGVFVEAFYVLSYFRPIVISMGEGGANTSCPGQRERWCWPSRGRWAVLSTGRVFARRNEDEHPDWRHYRPALGRQG